MLHDRGPLVERTSLTLHNNLLYTFDCRQGKSTPLIINENLTQKSLRESLVIINDPARRNSRERPSKEISILASDGEQVRK